MLTAEHEAAELLRRARLKAHATPRAGRHGLRWLLALLGWRTSRENHAAISGRN
jgi:hypothetical protein